MMRSRRRDSDAAALAGLREAVCFCLGAAAERRSRLRTLTPEEPARAAVSDAEGTSEVPFGSIFLFISNVGVMVWVYELELMRKS